MKTVKVNVLIGGTLTNPVLKNRIKRGDGKMLQMTLKLKYKMKLVKKKTRSNGKSYCRSKCEGPGIIRPNAENSVDAIMLEAKGFGRKKARQKPNLQIDKTEC